MIELANITKNFGETSVLKQVNVAIEEGEVVSIIGPSGAGKSTFLRCINGLEQADSGTIKFADRSIDLAGISKKDALYLRRITAMVFQGFYLFNNKTVLENITEGLIIVKKNKKSEAIDKAEEILKQVDLLEKKDAYPSSLSGGQQQRVAIGRAMALEPKIFLFDEPTSALDPELVSEVLSIIRQLANKNKTMLIVTHEINFARNVSHRICFMDQGTIIEEGDAKELIDQPKNERTQIFLNKMQTREPITV